MGRVVTRNQHCVFNKVKYKAVFIRRITAQMSLERNEKSTQNSKSTELKFCPENRQNYCNCFNFVVVAYDDSNDEKLT